MSFTNYKIAYIFIFAGIIIENNEEKILSSIFWSTDHCFFSL